MSASATGVAGSVTVPVACVRVVMIWWERVLGGAGKSVTPVDMNLVGMAWRRTYMSLEGVERVVV